MVNDISDCQSSA